jgi:hypothetical protein
MVAAGRAEARDIGVVHVPQSLALIAPEPAGLSCGGQRGGGGGWHKEAVVAAALAGVSLGAAGGADPGGAVAGVPQALAVLAPGPVPLVGGVLAERAACAALGQGVVGAAGGAVAQGGGILRAGFVAGPVSAVLQARALVAPAPAALGSQRRGRGDHGRGAREDDSRAGGGGAAQQCPAGAGTRGAAARYAWPAHQGPGNRDRRGGPPARDSSWAGQQRAWARTAGVQLSGTA